MQILGIDPGNIESAYVVIDENCKPLEFGKVENGKLLSMCYGSTADAAAIEMVASYGMAVGAEVFETVYWIGRFYEALRSSECPCIDRVYRKDVKLHLCHDSRAKDANIRQALIDRFGGKQETKKGGKLYGISKDMWSALAVAVTYSDQTKEA